MLQHEKAKHAEGSDDPGAILKVIDSVKGQQERILVSLQEQQQALEQELTGGLIVFSLSYIVSVLYCPCLTLSLS